MIAAHALSGNFVLVTNNEKEFKCVKNLKIENWAKWKSQNSCNKTTGIGGAAGENPNSGVHQVLDAVYRITDIRELCLSWGDALLPAVGGLCVAYQSLTGFLTEIVDKIVFLMENILQIHRL